MRTEDTSANIEESSPKRGLNEVRETPDTDIVVSSLRAYQEHTKKVHNFIIKRAGKSWIPLSKLERDMGTVPIQQGNYNRRFKRLAKRVGFDYNNNSKLKLTSQKMVESAIVKENVKKRDTAIKQKRKIKDDLNFSPPQAALDTIKVALGQHGTYIVLLIEDMYFLYRSLLLARTNFDRIFAIEHVLRARTGKPFVMMALDAYTTVKSGSWFTRIKEKLDELFPLAKEQEEVQSAEEVIGLLRAGVDRFDMARKSNVFKKLHKFGTYCISLSLFDYLGVEFSPERQELFDRYFKRKDLVYGTDFYHCILDTIVTVLERGVAVVTTGSLGAFFHSSDNYTKWVDRATKLLRDSKFLGNPEPHGIKPETYFNDLMEVIQQGTAIINYAKSMHAGELKYVRGLLAELELVKANELTVSSALKMRKAPFGILIHGASAQMKTAFYRTIIHFYANKFEKPMGDEYIYTRNFFDDFFSAFRSTMWCMIYDDAAYMNPNQAQGIDPSLAEIIQVLNNVPVITNQARLEDKGTVPCQPELVVITTNTKHLNAFAYFSHPHAVQRRTPYVITISVKPEFMSPDGQMIMASSIPVTDGYMNVWEIKVERVLKPRTEHGVCEYETIGIYTDIYDFLDWFNGACDDHTFRQERADIYNTHLNTFKLCTACIRHPCICAPVPNELVAPEDDIEGLPDLVANDSDSGEESEPQANDTTLVLGEPQSEFVDGINAILWALFVQAITVQFAHGLFMFRHLPIFFYEFIFKYFILAFCYIFMKFSTVRTWTSRFFWSEPVQSRLMQFGRERMAEWRRQAFAHVGARINNANPILKKAAAMLAAITLVYTAYSLTKRATTILSEPQMDIKEVGSTPTGNDKVENPWKKTDLTLAPCDLSNQALSWKTMSDEELSNQLMRNAVALEMLYLDGEVFKKKSTRAFCVGGRLYVANKHGLPPSATFDVSIIHSPVEEGITANFKERLCQEDLFSIPETDLVFFELSCPAKRDRSQLFASPSLKSSYNALYIGRNFLGKKEIRTVRSAARTVRAAPPSANLSHPLEGWVGYLDGPPTVSGDCGTILVLKTAFGPQIAGLHYSVATREGAKDSICFAIDLNSEHINLAKLHFGEGPQGGTISLKEGEYGRNLTALADKSVFNYIQEGTAEVMGSLDGHRPKHRSSVVRTPICEEVMRHGYQLTTGPPVLKGWEIWRNAALDMLSADDYMDPKILRDCMQCFLKHVCENVDLSKVHVYDLKTAMQGADGVQYVDSINWGTSMGYPWNKAKKNFVLDPTAEKKEFTPEVIEAAQRLLDKYESGERAYPIFTATPKDEPRKFSKIKSKQTRIFAAAPAHFCLVMRMYFLPLVRLMQNNRFIFCAAPGIDVSSLQWEELYNWMTELGLDCHIAGDYAAFDKNMKAKVILMAFKFLILIAELAGYPPAALRIMHYITEDIAFPLMVFNGDLVMFFGTNPSGHPLTVIINCIVGVLYMMYCFVKLKPDGYDLGQFFKLVRLITYGDDNHLGVSPTIPWFNHSSIADTLAEIGIVYTMADKEAESVPYIHISEVTFLKRSFRYDADVGAVLAPLDENSIGKMLTMHVVSKAISQEDQILQTVGAASAEYFFYGKEIFIAKQTMLREVLEKCNLSVFIKSYTFQTWEQLYNRFWENSCARGLITQVELETKRVTCTAVTVDEDFVSSYSDEEWVVQDSDKANP